jgi:NAD(P)H-hydrate epimerase
VADADALRAANEIPGGAKYRGRWVLTPHPGEFAFISDRERTELFSDPIAAVLEAAERLDAVVLLKAHVCYIAAPDGRYAVVDGMNPAMGTGGSGDVLAGTIGGLLAGQEEPFSAACRAARVHQSAGSKAAACDGWFTAEELPPIIGRLLWHGEPDE